MSTPASIKDRAEQTIIGILQQDATLATLPINEQATNNQQFTNPRIAVVAQVGKEYVLGGGIFRITVTIEIFCNISQAGQTPDIMEDYANRVDIQLATAQASGVIGVIRNGGSTSLNNLTAKRTISVTIIGA